jgi:hypothetical protein
MNNKPFAEVIESSLQSWLAQSWQWDYFPPFGALVLIQQSNRTLFGIVHQVQTSSMDPMRYPFPYQKTEEELLREQPQIFEFLKTTFSCITLGYQENGTIFYQLTPQPPKIHAFVSHADIALSKQFFSHDNYLHCLFNASQIAHLDELLLAILRQQVHLQILDQRKVERFMHLYSLLTGNNYQRLKLFLQRASTLLHIVP